MDAIWWWIGDFSGFMVWVMEEAGFFGWFFRCLLVVFEAVEVD